ncbi:cytochrome o ubiquinol oxidase subunit IV [Nitrospirillum sp. BR 11752]|uniref:cytochrome o ubiquinol oxidase subunit IV n=1 Tax=Nitrospirillum sp. BR 11752 TaxID=3104293 RepID=UPI002EA52D6B|nr:cytochrome o ubiquinol oxidase subunit IV [Nitrospirillum sp. BR 11752]
MAETDHHAPDGIPHDAVPLDTAPGDSREELLASLKVYIVGLALAILLTATSFWAASTHVLWPQGVPIGLAVLAVAQMGVHLVFFLHITTGPDNTNNVLALAFGVLIVFLVVAGSLWIMANLSANMMPLEMMDLHHQH